MQKQLNVILNGKGGVGKSFFAVNFVQYLKDRHIGHQSIDTDNENSTLKRFHREADFVNIGNVREIDQIFTHLDTSNVVVVDCRAASTDIFLDYFAEIRAFEILEAINATLTVIAPVNHEADSVEQIKIIAQALGNKCGYLVVKNQAHSEHFRIYERSNTRGRIMEELAGREIVMPKLYDWLVTALNETNLSITEAIKRPEFPLVDRQRLKNWQAIFNGQVDGVRNLLLPDGDPNEAGPKSEKSQTPDKPAASAS